MTRKMKENERETSYLWADRQAQENEWADGRILEAEETADRQWERKRHVTV
jgi:hypothetical protein